MKDIPLGLRHSLESGECVLFVGSGIGDNLKALDGGSLPTGYTMAKELADEYKIEAKEYKLPDISKLIEIRKGRPELMAFLKRRLEILEPDETMKWICSVKWKAIYTTNYDNGIQKAYDAVANPKQNYITITATSEVTPYDTRFDLPIFHLHGALFGTGKPEIVITNDDYTKFKEKRRMLFELLKHDFSTSNFLYIGYANLDLDWQLVLNEIEEEFYPSEMPDSYRVAPETDDVYREILEDKRIYTLDMDCDEFVTRATAELNISDADTQRMEKYIHIIPSELYTSFNKNPAATIRLTSSWEYINQAPFGDRPNTELFLKGDRPNWALIGAKKYFTRDLEDELYDVLLDYATSTKPSTKALNILAPAGYGTTTLLMTLAGALVRERAGSIYMLKPGRQIIVGDIEYAVDISEGPIFFFVDNAADEIENIKNSIQRLKEVNKAALFVLGERLNEWRQSSNSVIGKEFQIEPLSDPEIYRLLDFLGENSALNKLEPLSPDLQFAAVKKNYNKELLVAMREATEDKRFDAILEDEYRSIQNEKAQYAYLIVCCFSLHGAYIRENLLANLLGLNFAELHMEIGDNTEGILFYDEIDPGRRIDGVRTRHRNIAEVVWLRCGSQAQKSEIIQNTLNSLNLNYNIDAKAFESFYRSDELIDSINTLDAKTTFFEKACKKDPDSPYVRQHYARMFLREEKLDAALSQIETALNKNSTVKILYHTKGLILAKITLQNESTDIARRRLAQSENNFRKGISLNPRNNYCYKDLAELYLNWAKRLEDEKEISEYIEKAESIISEGLKEVRNKEALWIVSAEIQKFLGDNPRYIRFMQQAIADAPQSIIGRYLLGRTFRKNGDYSKAIEILEPVIFNHPEEFRSYVEYALSLYLSGETYKRCTAILFQSTLYGYHDPRFLATLGGMLFMDGEFSEANKVFEESNKRNFSVAELNSIQFIPIEPIKREKYQELNGTVVHVRAGYCLIEVPGYPKPFLCPGSKYKGILMENNLKLTISIGFTAKGPIAIYPKKL